MIFAREFPIERLSNAILEENGWLCDRLPHWHPTGDAIDRYMDQEDEERLRLAVRNAI
jgi:hypothetical protein